MLFFFYENRCRGQLKVCTYGYVKFRRCTRSCLLELYSAFSISFLQCAVFKPTLKIHVSKFCSIDWIKLKKCFSAWRRKYNFQQGRFFFFIDKSSLKWYFRKYKYKLPFLWKHASSLWDQCRRWRRSAARIWKIYFKTGSFVLQSKNEYK